MSKIYKDAEQEHLAAIHVGFINKEMLENLDIRDVEFIKWYMQQTSESDALVTEDGRFATIEDVFGSEIISEVAKLLECPGLYVTATDDHLNVSNRVTSFTVYGIDNTMAGSIMFSAGDKTYTLTTKKAINEVRSIFESGGSIEDYNPLSVE